MSLIFMARYFVFILTEKRNPFVPAGKRVNETCGRDANGTVP